MKKRRSKKEVVKTDGEIESSGFSDRTNNRNIREPVSAESINRPSVISFPRALRSSILFFLFSLILPYDPVAVTIGEVLPAECFPSVREFS